MKKWRFIDTGEDICYSNMAVDEALFQAYDASCSMPILRIYSWSPPAFSIGISQDPVVELDLRECDRSGVGFVRRMTGGGIILHDNELTYSIVCSEKDIERTYFAKELYRTLCSFLIEAYRVMGIDAEFSLRADKAPKSGWVCFKQKERYDIVIDGRKIGGNAQRRKRALIFQHGSIPLKLSPERYQRFLKNKKILDEDDACSLSQILKRDIGYDELRRNLLTAFKSSFNAELAYDTLTPAEQSLRNHLLKSKYSTKEWNFFMVQESIKHFPIPLRRSPKVIAKGDFLEDAYKQRPSWLDKKISLKDCSQMKGLLRGLGLNTVCEEAACPNISECFVKGIATFMILGSNCTRSCKFCNVGKGEPSLLDASEPCRVGEAVKRLRLSHVVVTSVTRDDLKDGGASHFADTIKSIRRESGKTTIEVLIPDFKADIDAISCVVDAAPDIINHNVETVPRLYPEVRPEADYKRSLEVLMIAKDIVKGEIYTKSGIMLGLGETREEVLEVLRDLRGAGCDLLSIGQYLAPSKLHYPVKDYIEPELFRYYKEQAGSFGFQFTASAPYARSSYHADEYIKMENRL